MTRGREINFGYILSTCGTSVGLNYYFICEILLMHREGVYNKTVSVEAENTISHVCRVLNSICQHSK